MADLDAILSGNLAEVEERIWAACARAERDRSEVTLVAVTKYVSTEVARGLLRHGVTDLGESRPQELWKKAAAIPEAKWHLVGHLQRNKVERTLPLVQLIHSVDSIRLLEALEAEAAKQQRTVEVLLELNLSGEEAKHGFRPGGNEIETLPATLSRLQHVRVIGLMTMAALEENSERSRPAFTRLREFREKMAGMGFGACRHLSMGMSNDFEVAIEEGATLVRIGTALFRGLEGVP